MAGPRHDVLLTQRLNDRVEGRVAGSASRSVRCPSLTRVRRDVISSEMDGDRDDSTWIASVRCFRLLLWRSAIGDPIIIAAASAQNCLNVNCISWVNVRTREIGVSRDEMALSSCSLGRASHLAVLRSDSPPHPCTIPTLLGTLPDGGMWKLQNGMSMHPHTPMCPDVFALGVTTRIYSPTPDGADCLHCPVVSDDGTRVFASQFHGSAFGVYIFSLSTAGAVRVGLFRPGPRDHPWALAFDTNMSIPDSVLYVGTELNLYRCVLPFRYTQWSKWAAHDGLWLQPYLLRDVWNIVFEYAAASDSDVPADAEQMPLDGGNFDPSDMHMLASGKLLCLMRGHLYLVDPRRGTVVHAGTIMPSSTGCETFAVDDIDRCVYYGWEGNIRRMSLPPALFHPSPH